MLCPMASVSDYGVRGVRISVHSTVLGLACVALRSYDAVIESRFSFLNLFFMSFVVLNRCFTSCINFRLFPVPTGQFS
jgi:hypothetical protein